MDKILSCNCSKCNQKLKLIYGYVDKVPFIDTYGCNISIPNKLWAYDDIKSRIRIRTAAGEIIDEPAFIFSQNAFTSSQNFVCRRYTGKRLSEIKTIYCYCGRYNLIRRFKVVEI